MLAQFTGIGYVAAVVSRLIGMTVIRHRDRGNATPREQRDHALRSPGEESPGEDIAARLFIRVTLSDRMHRGTQPPLPGATMRHARTLICLLGLLTATPTLACDIVDKREIHVGASKGIAGKCSNNAHAVQCFAQSAGSENFTCNGPEGSYDGPDLKTLIATACGCGANPAGGATDQLDEELAD